HNRISTINTAAKSMLRLEDADFTGIELDAIVERENGTVLNRVMGRARRVGFASEQTTLRRERDDGDSNDTPMSVALTASALPDGGGAVLVIEDLSELMAAQRASAWQEVARRMAHEIKNPLTPIQLSAERIAKRFAEAPQFAVTGAFAPGANVPTSQDPLQSVIDESTATILREVHSLKTMVDEFSRFAKLPDAKLETGHLNDVVALAVEVFNDRFDDVRIETELGSGIPDTQVDREQLKRVFVNLIENSVEAFADDAVEKVVSIATRHDTARDLLIAQVSDTGKGIDPANLQRLFQPYFSTKGRGTGLGLAIVRRIVTEHGGKIFGVANAPQGAKFIIELPVS
ncbi:MAG: GHKL domain-containing protein, partial [Blastocatellia bacterium]|nr:GHKL domain-containing protein [Blastocatellia bacterium]